MIILWFTFILLFIVFILWLGNYSNQKRGEPSNEQLPPWQEFVNEFKSLTDQFKRMDQLEEYLQTIQDRYRNYETDYSFLVRFNSVKREAIDRLKQE